MNVQTLNVKNKGQAEIFGKNVSINNEYVSCGNWQSDYTTKIANTSNRLLIGEFVGSGMADRMTFLVTTFLYALLTNRAYRIHWQVYDLAAAFEPNAFDYVYKKEEEGSDVEFFDEYKGDIGYSDHWINRAFGEMNLNHLSSKRAVKIAGNQGQIYRLFSNPHHKDELMRLGLRPDTAVGCILNYLFKLNKPTLEIMKEEFKALTQPNTLRIGLQIRYGDAALRGVKKDTCFNGFDSPILYPFLRCAENIEKSRAMPGQKVVWFVVTDCYGLRVALKERYGDKIITNVKYHPQHVESLNQKEGLMLAAGELWLFGMTDFQVISQFSSFGRLGALRGMRWRSIYTVRGNLPTCDLVHWESFEQTSMDFTRI